MLRRGVLWVATLGLVPACDGCGPAAAVTTSEPPASTISVVDAGRDSDPGAAAPKKGSGWYPNVEVDADNRLHLAWVDADVGDVRAAVTVVGGHELEPGPDGQRFVTVDADGAVGAFLRLTVAPGGAPLLSYARQDTGIFRLAWRPADRPLMKAAGADVDDTPFPTLPTASVTGAPIALRDGFVGEELGFGEQVGRGHGISVDGRGRIALAYYSADDRLRLVRRPKDVAAFAADSVGTLEKRDLDAFARGSVRASADVLVLEDDTVVVAYPHDAVTDARLRIAVLRPESDRAVVVEDTRGRTVTLDGLAPRLARRPDGLVDVVAHDRVEGRVLRRELDVATATLTETRERLVDIAGAVVAAPAPAGGWHLLARVPGDGGGVFLYVVEGAPDAREVRRIRLDGGGAQTDAWLDVVTRPDGRPAAVWFHADEGLKLYAP